MWRVLLNTNLTAFWKVFREIYKNSWDSETRLRESDDHHIDVQVLSTVPVMYSYWAKPEHTQDLSRYLNDNIAQTVSENPRRYAGLGTLPMQAPELAVKELHRLKDDLGLQGVQIGTNVLGKNLDHESLFPIFEECSDMGACVFVHPWDMVSCYCFCSVFCRYAVSETDDGDARAQVGEDRMQDYWLPHLVGMPAETSLAICSMIFGGVLEKYSFFAPRISFFPHRTHLSSSSSSSSSLSLSLSLSFLSSRFFQASQPQSRLFPRWRRLSCHARSHRAGLSCATRPVR